jgi:broad specificity phosphatase PhoE
MTGKPRPLPLIYLVRHGETEWSLSGQHTGRTDLPLTERGEHDARQLTARLGAVDFSHVLTSPLLRARRTTELAGLGDAAKIDADAVEWNYGDYEGQRPADIRKERPDWNIFQDGCPSGESPEQVSDRADRLIGRLRNLEGNVALVSHGQFGLPVRQAQHLLLSTASISILGFEHDRVEAPAIILWNAPAKDAPRPA